MKLQNFAYYATIGTLLIATITYWLDWTRNNLKIKAIKKLLNVELRTMYDSVRDDIIQYQAVKDSDYSASFICKVYNNPISQGLLESGKFIELFKKPEDFSCFSIICMMIKQIEQVDQRALQRGDKRLIDHFFENRLVELREALIELSEHSNFIKLQIIPKKHLGAMSTIQHLQKYEASQAKEMECLNVINENFSKFNCRKLPRHHFE